MADEYATDDAYADYDPRAGKDREEILAMFPETTEEWRCPACGKRVTGNFNLDSVRKKCTKTWHTHSPIKCAYVRRDKALETVVDAIEGQGHADEILRRVEARLEEIGNA